MRALRSLTLLACGLSLVGCVPTDGADTTTDLPDQSRQHPAGEVDPIASQPRPRDYVAVDGERELEGVAEPAPAPTEAPRLLRRMTIDQLQESIKAVTGGLSWRNRHSDEFERLKKTLGVPNYLDTTNEDLDASLVFQKFLGDATRTVCNEAIDNDRLMEPGDRVMVRFVPFDVGWEDADEEERAAIDRNLRYMKLRITGHYVAPDDEAGQVRLRWLFRSVSLSTGEPARGWRAVCVVLMSSPEFYLY
jgi:hypothetical protein